MMELARNADGKPMGIAPVKDVLQVRDVSTVEARGMNEQQIEQLRQFIQQMGVSDAQITHPTTTLEDLFMRIVRENTRPGESTVGSRQP
jgi:ABC-2 type transport system ATP-binding protein